MRYDGGSGSRSSIVDSPLLLPPGERQMWPPSSAASTSPFPCVPCGGRMVHFGPSSATLGRILSSSRCAGMGCLLQALPHSELPHGWSLLEYASRRKDLGPLDSIILGCRNRAVPRFSTETVTTSVATVAQAGEIARGPQNPRDGMETHVLLPSA